jgi:hypothetical protein
MYSAELLPHFVDESLSWLHEAHPTNATFDGVHAHDDLLEDLSRASLDAQCRDLGGFARRLAAIDPTRLTGVERLERPAIDASIRARLHELEVVRTWERNPQFYGDLLSTSLAGQVLFDYAPLAERGRRGLSKLRQVPRLMQAARDNIKDPPGIFIKVGLESLRGALRFIEDDLPRAFANFDDLRVLSDLADASTEASHALGSCITYLEEDRAPRARGRSASGASGSSRSWSWTKGSRSTYRACSTSRCASCAKCRRNSAARRRGSAAPIPPPPGRARRPIIRPPAMSSPPRRRSSRSSKRSSAATIS